MKKFARSKTLDEIKAQVKASGGKVTINTKLYDELGHDHVRLDGGGAHVIYNTVNGRFFGATPDGKSFHSSETTFENEPWFQQLLSFFMVEKQ